MTNWLKRLFGGGSEESSTSEAPEAVATPEAPPAPPAPAAAPETMSDDSSSDTGDEPA